MPPRTTEHQPLLPRAAEMAREVTRSNWEDFKEFINRGKVVDLAVGIVIGASFSSIVTSLVDDLLSPILSLVVGNQLEDAFILLKAPDMNSEACKQHEELCLDPKTPQQAHAVGAITFNYGHFIQRIINFFLIAVILFFLIKAYTKLLHKGSKFLKRYRDCPWCLEEIPEKARKCKYCGSEVVPLNHGVELAIDRPPPGVAH
ncbi:large conductance mechanosensitive channel protein [Spizellomyces punctatus DAOM BR117]|uniref:Large conductance mechanosensitive channel protein n=1 Tax=Spizellomyces punctatus (strain DAOM BR117) TaxID=645134 RepID=A0A0L0HGV3_SPIPD|nr:large conductance mechanosensitive channel protein [Spizellomyces punctatus DAOM BR117]KND00307.1 large conductance mechanosensitive channel protein [Spizellomyces punctatus DAOM BR117]|eukprot:XP_016608346.1 large conductance mechanosensitive channel protein [Spizellomyces punctatus DAOM BR117]